jgi:hypothetical protein
MYRLAIWDPASGRTRVASVTGDQCLGHTATLLLDGQVLVIGGMSGASQPTNEADLCKP